MSDQQMAADPPDATAEHWREVARRTRQIASQWKSLFHQEEAKVAEAKAAVAHARQLQRKAESDRDLALRRCDEATKGRSSATAQAAQWKARSGSQTTAKSFVALEATRTRLAETDALLNTTQRAYEALMREFEEFKSASAREAEERQMLADEHKATMRRNAEDLQEDKRDLQDQLAREQARLTEQLTSNPPGALTSAQVALRGQAVEMRRMERVCDQLRREAERWRDRAKNSLASERLVQLKNGPSAMVVPGVAPNSLSLLAADKSARVQTPHALQLAQAKAAGGAAGAAQAAGAAASDPDMEGPDEDDPLRLRAQVDYWRGEAEHEQMRQRAFGQALWGAADLTQAQKLKVMAWLRQPPEVDEGAGTDPFSGVSADEYERLVATAPPGAMHTAAPPPAMAASFSARGPRPPRAERLLTSS